MCCLQQGAAPGTADQQQLAAREADVQKAEARLQTQQQQLAQDKLQLQQQQQSLGASQQQLSQAQQQLQQQQTVSGQADEQLRKQLAASTAEVRHYRMQIFCVMLIVLFNCIRGADLRSSHLQTSSAVWLRQSVSDV